MSELKKFTNESMVEIFDYLTNELKDKTKISFEVLNPDTQKSTYAGQKITIEDQYYLYRGYKAFSDLAELLHCRTLTPLINSDITVILTFEKLETQDSFHTNSVSLKEEKYGVESTFFSINKNEEPSFLAAYLKALKSVKVDEKSNILNLGINRGDEFELIKKIVPLKRLSEINFIGVDHSKSAIKFAKNRFDGENFNFYTHDINALHELNLPRSDLIISIGTLQSSTLDFKKLFMSLVQEYLTKDGAIILGFPNCRWIDGEMIYGAKAPNYPYSELSIVIKDIYFCKKYLQQHKFRVTITGKNYLFLTATSIAKQS